MSFTNNAVDLNAPFWQDVPDTVLEELYRQMDAGVDLDSLDFMDDSGETVMEEGRQEHLPSLFPTTSYTDIAEIKPDRFYQNWDQPRLENDQNAMLIERITQFEIQQQEQLEKLCILQKQICSSETSKQTDIENLQQQMYLLHQQINSELKELQTINCSSILPPAELHQSRVLGQKLQLQQNLLELFKRELMVLSNSSSEPLAMLVLEDQPIPQVTFKGKALEDCYTVKLLTATNVDIQNVSQVKCQLVSEERSWKTNKPLDNDETNLDPKFKVASFHHLKIQVSTRMSMVNLRFAVQIQSRQSTSVIQSSPSYPIIVITNESQWCEAAGKLVVLDSFANELEIPWTQFANGLHHHFLKATKQEPDRPVRCIKAHEFAFFHKKFFNSRAMINTQQFSKFWSWFGPILQTLRFKRHISTLWLYGLIYGLITKGDSTHALHNQPEGTFLIRFSESYPGLFAIAYVSDDPSERVKHYLVKPEDTGSQKTLPDFLREKQQFKYLLQLDVSNGHLNRAEKDSVLSTMYSKKQLNTQSNGYVLL